MIKPFVTFVFLVATGFSSAIQAAEGPAFSNPLLTTAQILQARGQVQPATHRLNYVIERDLGKDAPKQSTLQFDLANDWALITTDGKAIMLDFKLNRNFVLNSEKQEFISYNLNAGPAFRVSEYQNRIMLGLMLAKTGLDQSSDSCDLGTVLGVVLPSSRPEPLVEVDQSGDSVKLMCGGEEIGAAELTGDDRMPATFWPALLNAMSAHPSLLDRLRSDGRAIAKLNWKSDGLAAGVVETTSLTLESVETLSTDYPLNAGHANSTSTILDRILGDGFGDFALATLAGDTEGGPMSLREWDVRLGRKLEEEGPAALSFELLGTLRKYPEAAAKCQAGEPLAFCQGLGLLRSQMESDAAVRAYLLIAAMEQKRELGGVVETMKSAEASPLGDHPALGAAFALALIQGGAELQDLASSAGLDADIHRLQERAIRSDPYDPLYWQDVGDGFEARYEFQTAYLFYDLAQSIPSGSSVPVIDGLVPRMELVKKIQNDFPQFYLPE